MSSLIIVNTVTVLSQLQYLLSWHLLICTVPTLYHSGLPPVYCHLIKRRSKLMDSRYLDLCEQLMSNNLSRNSLSIGTQQLNDVLICNRLGPLALLELLQSINVTVWWSLTTFVTLSIFPPQSYRRSSNVLAGLYHTIVHSSMVYISPDFQNWAHCTVKS